MRLELGIIKINEVQFGKETVVKDGTLHVNRDELIALTTQDDRLSQADVEKDPKYQKLLKKYQTEQEELIKEIEKLDALKTKDAKWKDEIEATVKRLKEGFLVTERDPQKEEIEKEIEYWLGTLGELDE